MTPKPESTREAALRERLDSGIERIPESGCWIWMGTITPLGYGRIAFKKKDKAAHRVMYEAVIGPIPEGLTIDHLCRVRCCVNPSHLEPVTSKENVLRGIGPTAINAKKTHCKYGHPLSGENLVIKRKRTRECRECGRAEDRRYKVRHQNKEKSQ